MIAKEFNIPVPWGHVAVKAWGKEENTPVFMMHGIGDSASSFDRLVHHLPDSFYYVCIDVPGHGKSSHYPPHLFVSLWNNIITMKLALDYLNRGRYILITHSWSGQTTAIFTQLYPEYVTKLVMLDIFYVFPVGSKHFKRFLGDKITNTIKVIEQTNKKQSSYTVDEAVSKLIQNHSIDNLSRETAEMILSRSLIPNGDGKFKNSIDSRLRDYLNPIYDEAFLWEHMRKHPIRCPILFIYASNSETQYRYFKKIFVDELEKGNPECYIYKVTGYHNIHNDDPELVGSLISKFLINKCKL